MQKLGKRLLLLEADRNTASPTESAVWKRKQREHSGADWLNYSRSVRSARYARREGRWSIHFPMRVVPRIRRLFAPEYESVFRGYFYTPG